MKWLEEEKAECPVCRFSLKSKEVNENQNFDDGNDGDDGDDGDCDESSDNFDGTHYLLLRNKALHT